MNKYYFSFLAVLLAFSTAMRAQTSQPQPANALEVEVLLFSGRPNPRFTVTDPAEIQEILGLVKGLPTPAASATAAKSPESPSALGYQGIAVRNHSKASSDVQSLVVKRSVVRVVRGNTSITPGKTNEASVSAASSPPQEVRIDSSSGLERRLLALAQNRGVIDSGLLAHINNAP